MNMQKSTRNVPKRTSQGTPKTASKAAPKTASKAAGKRVKEKAPVGLIAGIVAAAVVAVVVGGYFGLCSWVQGNDRLLPGAVARDANGTQVDLSKLTREDALAAVTKEMGQQLDSRKLTLRYGEDKQVELTGELMTCFPEGTVDVGFSAKENKPFWKLGALWLGLAREPADLPLSAAVFTAEGETQVRQLLRAIADELYVAPMDFTYELGDETVEVTPGNDGQELDTDTLFTAVENALIQGATELWIEPETVPSAELSGRVLSELIHIEPQPAGVDANGNLTPAVIGLSVNAEEAQSCLDAAEPGQPVIIPLERTLPGLSGDESMYYKDLLATCTTSISGTANRLNNVTRAAGSCNDKVLLPGEVFSYLDTIGEPSLANGYMAAPAYVNGLTVQEVGGGICQVSSSIYYCAVYSNLEIVSRVNHGYDVGYLPKGLDATVAYSYKLDFKFRNNTDYPIKIVTSVSGRTLTIQFYGSNPDGIKVETERHTLSTTAWTTVYQPDSSIPRGTTKEEVTPYTGYTVEVYRLVYDANGTLLSRTFENRSVYKSRNRVILYNPADEGPWGSGEPSISDPPVTDPPDITDPPETTDSPVVTDPPEVTDPPAVTDPPVVTEPPAVTDPPVVTDPPLTDLPEGE